MRGYCVVNGFGEPLLSTLFSTHERAGRALGDDLGDSYLIREREMSDDQYFEMLANEAHDDAEQGLVVSGDGFCGEE
jgi:hypothetical protein